MKEFNHEKANTVRFHSSDIPRVATFTETEERWLPGAAGRRKWGVIVSWVRSFWFCKMKRVLETDGGVGCTTMWVDVIPVNRTPKRSSMANFKLCVPYHSFFKKERVEDKLHRDWPGLVYLLRCQVTTLKNNKELAVYCHLQFIKEELFLDFKNEWKTASR